MNNQLLLIIIIIIVIFFIYNSTTKSVKQQFSSMSDTFIPHIDTATIFNNDDYVDEIFRINYNDSLVLLAQNKQIDAAFFDAAFFDAAFFDAGHGDQLLGDTAHIGVDRLAGNDAFHWILDYGNDVATLNNDNYVDKIVGTNSNNSSALLAQNKQIDDTVLGAGVTIAGFGDTAGLFFAGAGAGANILGAGAGDSAVPLGFRDYSNCFWCSF